MSESKKPTPPCSLTEMLSEIDVGSDKIYFGPGAYTIAEMKGQSPFGNEFIAERAEEKVAKGEWVRVKVQRTRRDKKAYYPQAYVKKEIYDEWMRRKGETNKLGEEDGIGNN